MGGSDKGGTLYCSLPLFYEQAIFKINYSPPPLPNPSPKKALEWACPLPRSPLWRPSQAPLTQAERWGVIIGGVSPLGGISLPEKALKTLLGEIRISLNCALSPHSPPPLLLKSPTVPITYIIYPERQYIC